MGDRLRRWNARAIEVREKFSIKGVLRSLIVFLISLVLFYSTQNDFLEALFGFVMIISGAVVVLFVIIFLIFLFLHRMKEVRMARKQKKKTKGKKKVVKKKVVSKKVVKKPVKKVVKKRVSKKRK